MNLITEHFESH